MKRATLTILFLCVFSAAWLPCYGAVVLNPVGGGLGTSVVVYEGLAEFQKDEDSTFPRFLADTLIEKTFDSAADIVFDNVTYAGSDLDWSTGFRWTERIHNDTGASWIEYHLQLDETPGVFFTDLPVFSPSYVTINSGESLPGATGPQPTIKKLEPAPGTLSLSADRKTLSFFFDTPVADRSFFDIHAPIQGLSSSGGSFELTQSPVVPEPASVVVWSLLGVVGVGTALWRRRKGAPEAQP
ncbi:MAG TPA: hypothetical protein VMY37_04665 [Thermoguttaceae bacterium]|nr:hypothetical protein [Thermoguttaceae bacterium]